MAESKRTFHAGKMNRDLDDRIVPNGEYRDAVNVNIGRSEGSSVGALENLKGNERIHNNLNLDFTAMEDQMFFDLPDNATGVFEVIVDGQVLPDTEWSFGNVGVTFETGVPAGTLVNITYDTQPDGLTIGTVVDPNNDRFYWFAAFQDINGIYEYDVNTGLTTTILTDRERRTAPLPTCAPTVEATVTRTNDSLGIRPDFPDFPEFPTGGCLDTTASNYEPTADYHDQSVCRYDVVGCGDPDALNYNSAVTVDDRSLCQYPLNNFTFEDSTLTCNVNQAGIATITWTRAGLLWSVNVEGETASQADDTDNDMSVSIDIGTSVGMDRPVLFQFTITVPDGFDNGPTISGGEAECWFLQEGTTAAPPGEFSLSIVAGSTPSNTSLVGNGVSVGAMGSDVTTDFTFTIHENTGFGFNSAPTITFPAQTGDGTVSVVSTPTATGSYQVDVTEVTIGTENTILEATWDVGVTGVTALYSPGDLDISCSISREGVISVTEANSVAITWQIQRLDSDDNRTGPVTTGSPTSVPPNTDVDGRRWIVDVTAIVPSGYPNSPGSVGVTAGLYTTTVETSCSTDQPGTRPPTFTTMVTTLDPGPNTEFVGVYTSEPGETGTAFTTNTLFEVTPSIGYRFNRPGDVTPRIVNTTSGQMPEDVSRVSFTVNDGGDSPDTANVTGVTIGAENETYEVRWEAADEVTFDSVTVTLTLEQPNNATATWTSAPARSSLTFSGAPGDTLMISETVTVVIDEGFIDQNPGFLGPSTVLLADGAMIPSSFPAPTGTPTLLQGFSLSGTVLAQINFPAENQEIIISVENTYVRRAAGRVYRISSDGVNFGVRADGSVIAANTMLLYDPPVDPVNNPFAGAFGGGFGAMGDAGSFALLALDRNPVVYEVCSTTRPRFQNLAGGFDPNVNRAQSSFTITGPFETCYSDSLSGGSFHRASGGPGS